MLGWRAAYVHVPLVPLISIPLFLGSVIYAFGWLIDGFVRPAAKRHHTRPGATVISVISYLKLSCGTRSTGAILEDNVKPSAPLWRESWAVF
jgi:hypothetical protein